VGQTCIDRGLAAARTCRPAAPPKAKTLRRVPGSTRCPKRPRFENRRKMASKGRQSLVPVSTSSLNSRMSIGGPGIKQAATKRQSLAANPTDMRRSTIGRCDSLTPAQTAGAVDWKSDAGDQVYSVKPRTCSKIHVHSKTRTTATIASGNSLRSWPSLGTSTQCHRRFSLRLARKIS
jgi:hypothetical protein